MEIYRRPLFPLACAYFLGTVSAIHCRFPPILAIGTIIFTLAVGYLSIRRQSAHTQAVILFAAFCLGAVRTSVFIRKPAQDVSGFAEGELVQLTGRVDSDLEQFDDRIRFILNCNRVKTYDGDFETRGRVMVILYRSASDKNAVFPFFGDVVVLKGRLRRPSPPTNPGAFDYARFLSRHRVWCVLSGEANQVRVVRLGHPSLYRIAYRFRSTITSKAFEIMPEQQARLSIGILFGNYAALPIEVQASFVRTGTMHLLAASGYNCGVIVAILGFLLLRLTIVRSWRYALLIIVLWVYAVIVGGSPSIIRAATMVTLFMVAYLLWRAPDVENIMLAAALAICAWNPLNLYDVGFQLSFGAVLGIIMFLPFLKLFATTRSLQMGFRIGALEVVGGILIKASEIITTAIVLSIAALAGTLPITAYYFNYVSVVGILANALTALLVVALTSCVIPALAIAFVLPAFGKLLGQVGGFVATLMLVVVNRLADLPWAILSVRSPSAFSILLYYVLFFVIQEYAVRKFATKKRIPSAL